MSPRGESIRTPVDTSMPILLGPDVEMSHHSGADAAVVLDAAEVLAIFQASTPRDAM